MLGPRHTGPSTLSTAIRSSSDRRNIHDPWSLIDTAQVPGGGELRLMRRGAEFSIRLGSNELMNSRLSGSDIFQRHVVLCGNTRFGGGVEGLTSRVFRRGTEVNATTNPEALTGKVVDIVALVANTLAAFGEKLSAGDVVITGSITPPVMIEPDETEFTHALDPIGEVTVKFTWE